MNDALISEVRAKLYSGVISDVLDGLGNMQHALAPRIRPLDETLVMFGRARTAQYMPVYHVEPGSNPYELEIALIDSLRKDDVAVMACPGENRIAPWGELSDDGVARSPSCGLRHRWPGARRPSHPRDALSGFRRRRSARSTAKVAAR